MLKYCNQCTFDANSEQELFHHLVSVHHMTPETTPPELQYYWKNRIPGVGGFLERPNPLTGTAQQHQENMLKNMTIRQFNPNPTPIVITPICVHPWVKIGEGNYGLNQIIINTADNKQSIIGRISPGHGILKVISRVIEHKESWLKFLNQDIVNEDEKVILEEYSNYNPHHTDNEYNNWVNSFMKKSIDKINLVAPSINSNYFQE